MKKIIFLSLLLSFCFFSCDDDSDGGSTNFEDIDVLTGLTLVDENGQPLGLWNVPNENPGNLSVFPNPLHNNAFLTDSQEGIARVWIVPVDCMANNSSDIASASLNLSYTKSEIEDLALLDIPLQTPSISMSINFTDVPAGFYKVFAEMDSGAIYWINIYRIQANTTPAQAIGDLDNLCN